MKWMDKYPGSGWLVVAFLAIISSLVVFSRFEYSWESWQPAFCMPYDCFCEAVRSGILRQPSNTWSNLAFVIIGLWIWGITLRRMDTEIPTASVFPLISSALHGRTYAVTVILLGLMSFFYHASLTFLGQWCDVMSMYLIALYLIVYNISRLRPLQSAQFLSIFIALNGVAGFIQFQWQGARRYLFAVLVLCAIIFEIVFRKLRRVQMKNIYIYSAVASLSVAWVIWWLDLKRIVCWPESIFQGHALWHTFCALTTGLVFLYYRSEK